MIVSKNLGYYSLSSTIASDEDGKPVAIEFDANKAQIQNIKNALNEARRKQRALIDNAKQDFLKSGNNYIGDALAKVNAEKALKDRETAMKDINTSINQITTTSIVQQVKVDSANDAVVKVLIDLEVLKQSRDKENNILKSELDQISQLKDSITKLPAQGASIEGFQANIDKDLTE